MILILCSYDPVKSGDDLLNMNQLYLNDLFNFTVKLLLINILLLTSTASQLHMTLDDVINATDPDEIDQIIANWDTNDINDQPLEGEEHTSSVLQVNLTSTSPSLEVDVTSTLHLPEVNNIDNNSFNS